MNPMTLDKEANDLFAILELHGGTWKEIVNSMQLDDALKLRAFRERVANHLKALCTVQYNACSTSCNAFGSNQLTSDIDITISGSCLDKNLERLDMIHKELEKIFGAINIFKNSQGKFDIHKVFKVLDVNFYLSDFEQKRPEINQSIQPRLSDYYLATDEVQLNYALLVQQLNDMESYKETVKLLAKYKMSPVQQSNVVDGNNVINAVSFIAAFEDECYLTQGAFFHVVLTMQRGYKFDISGKEDVWLYMLVCSIIENLKFAVTHLGSRHKYIYRVADAVSRIVKLSQTLQGEFKWNNVNDVMLQRNLIQITEMTEDMLQAIKEKWTNLTVQLSLNSSSSSNSNTNIHGFQGALDAISRLGNKKKKLTSNAKANNVLANAQPGIDANEKVLANIQGNLNMFLVQETVDKVIKQTFKDFKQLSTRRYYTINAMRGGSMKLQQLRDKDGKTVKKTINGKERVVYVDSTRRQYVKNNGTMKAIVELRKAATPKSNKSKASKSSKN
jgi:hypothetical protein